MKVTVKQLNDIVKYVINESSEEKEVYIEPLTVMDEESGVEAVLSHEDKNFKLTVNGIQLNDPKKIAAVVTKAWLDASDYIANNPGDKSYIENLNNIVKEVFGEEGIDYLKHLKHSRNVMWTLIVQKFGKGKDRNS